jgi:hypothetical protein
MGRAFLFADDGDALQEWLDIPWRRADLYFIEKLAATAGAYGDSQWIDLKR